MVNGNRGMEVLRGKPMKYIGSAYFLHVEKPKGQTVQYVVAYDQYT